MKICEFCKCALPDNFTFCGQCGRRVSPPEEASHGGDVTQISNLHILDNTVTSVGDGTTFISNGSTTKETNHLHNTYFIHEDSDHEIINAYDIDTQRTAPLVDEDSEEEDDDKAYIPFLPM